MRLTLRGCWRCKVQNDVKVADLSPRAPFIVTDFGDYGAFSPSTCHCVITYDGETWNCPACGTVYFTKAEIEEMVRACQ